MKYMKRTLFFLLLTGIIAICFISCGKQQIQEKKEETLEENPLSENYTLKTVPLEAAISPSIKPVIMGQEIYYISEETEKNQYIIFYQNLENGTIEKTEFSTDTLRDIGNFTGKIFWNLGNFTVDLAKNQYFFLIIKSEDNSSAIWNRYLLKRNAKKEIEYFVNITEISSEDNLILFSLCTMKVDEQDRLHFQHNQDYIFDENGQYLGSEKIEFDGEKVQQLHQWKLELEKFGLPYNDIKEIIFLEDKKIEVLIKNNETGLFEMVMLTPSHTPWNEGKTELILGVLQNNTSISSHVVDFNKNHENTYITIQEYQSENSSRTVEQAISVLIGDILAGNGPDLITFSPGINYKSLITQGVLENLQPYVESSNIINPEDYFTNAWELGMQENFLFAIPVRFTLQTLVGKASILGTQEGFTITDIINLSQKYPDSLLIDPSSKSSIFSLCFSFQAETFINREKAECYFYSPEFQQILEFSNSFPMEANSLSNASKYQNNNVLLMEANLYNTASYLDIYQSFGMEPLNFVGYPTKDISSFGSLLSQCNEMYGISSRSLHKSEAWEFIEYYTQKEAKNSNLTLGFPTNKNLLKKVLIENIEISKQKEEKFFSAETLVDTFFTITEKSITDIGWINEVDFSEEIIIYFNGQKPLKETIDIIQNKVHLYLKENQP